MCGRATLAMVESSVFISVASIRAPVIGMRLAMSFWEAMARLHQRDRELAPLGGGRELGPDGRLARRVAGGLGSDVRRDQQRAQTGVLGAQDREAQVALVG